MRYYINIIGYYILYKYCRLVYITEKKGGYVWGSNGLKKAAEKHKRE